MSNWRTGLCVLILPLLLTVSAPRAQGESRADYQGGRRSVATVIFCGLGGAVVGLSTLSFYGQPADHTGNIYTGLGLGLIAGAAYVLSEPTPGSSYERAQNETSPQPRLSTFKNLFLEGRPVASFEIAAYRWEF